MALKRINKVSTTRERGVYPPLGDGCRVNYRLFSPPFWLVCVLIAVEGSQPRCLGFQGPYRLLSCVCGGVGMHLCNVCVCSRNSVSPTLESRTSEFFYYSFALFLAKLILYSLLTAPHYSQQKGSFSRY